MTKPATYREAGVDIDAANRATEKIKELARATFNQRTLSEIGSFGGMFDGAFPGMRQPVLVASADGVGTKLKIAFTTGIHNTIGRDLVNHCVNDILVQGARPLFFLDYIATGRLAPEVVAAIVEGIANGCRENGSVLLGGETAEMPGFYTDGEYDVAGFIVGVVDRERVIDGQAITPGDIVLGLPSSGLHTNGYSLARKLLFEVAGFQPDTFVPELQSTVADELLKVHRSYLQPIRKLMAAGVLKGAAHITGGGITDNTPRILPDNVGIQVDLSSWTPPPIFALLRRLGAIPEDDLRRTFNLGIGMILVVSRKDCAKAERLLRQMREPYFVIGTVVPRKPRRARVEYR